RGGARCPRRARHPASHHAAGTAAADGGGRLRGHRGIHARPGQASRPSRAVRALRLDALGPALHPSRGRPDPACVRHRPAPLTAGRQTAAKAASAVIALPTAGAVTTPGTAPTAGAVPTAGTVIAAGTGTGQQGAPVRPHGPGPSLSPASRICGSCLLLSRQALR